MKRFTSKIAIAAVVGASMGLAGPAIAQTPKSGGILNFVVGSSIPTFDGHRESTFGMVHPIRPFYSTLIRVNPDNPASPTDFKCDVCVGDVPKGEDGGLKYTFKIRSDIKFHDGTPLTSADVKATYDKIVFPKEGVPSNRKAFYTMIESIEAPDATTMVVKLKYPSGAFIPAMASPFNFIYPKHILDKEGAEWFTKNVMGSGPFMFVEYVPGSHVSGKKNPNYYFKGQPYLDGFKAISAPKMSVRLQAIRGDRAAIEFRGFPPKARDDLVKALGDKITVQESDWNCMLMVTPNQKAKPFDDPRVRRALTLSVDRWGGSKYLSEIAIVKTVGGIVFPNHPLAASETELVRMAGYGKDINASRAEAEKLLAESGHAGLKFELHNRGVDQPYRVVGTWAIDQWAKVGMKVTQRVQPSGPFYNTLRAKRDFEVSLDFNCQSVINPLADVSKFLGSAGNNYGQYDDPVVEELFQKMQRAGTEGEQYNLMRRYERRVLDEAAHEAVTLWWYKINPHRSYVKGWKIAPSHYLNQHLDNVWLDK